MIICIHEIYENETPQVYFIDTKLAKSKNQIIVSNFLTKIEDSASVPYSGLMVGDSGILDKMTTNPPCQVEKALDLYEDCRLNFDQWLKSIANTSSSKIINSTDIFVSNKAELPDGTPMKNGIRESIAYEVMALKDLQDESTKTVAVSKGEKCQVCFLGYTSPKAVGMFYQDYKPGYIPMFKIGKIDSKNVFQDYIFLKTPPVFGIDFAISLEVKKTKTLRK